MLNQSQIDRLARLMGNYLPLPWNSRHTPVTFTGWMVADVGGVTCTEYECQEHGSAYGLHAGQFCEHQAAMLDAAADWAEKMDRDDDYADLLATQAAAL